MLIARSILDILSQYIYITSIVKFYYTWKYNKYLLMFNSVCIILLQTLIQRSKDCIGSFDIILFGLICAAIVLQFDST